MSEPGTEGEPIRVVYVTAQLPYGATEPFLIPEIAELARQGCDVTIVPVRPKGTVVHADAAELLPRSACLPLISGAILRSALAEAVRSPGRVVRAFGSICRSRNPWIFLKNLAVFPKALWLARHVGSRGADHLHAHWAGTSATLAMVASEVSGIPWSLTAHRWDIPENNLLKLKARSACFVRAISEHGADRLRAIVDRRDWTPWVLHMGVELRSPAPLTAAPPSPLRILTAASFVPVKGHTLLIDAVRELKRSGVSVRAEFAGDGPRESALRGHTAYLGVEDDVIFLGRVSHDHLLSALSAGTWDVVVLPSIVTASGEHEGIPVSLIEAMAAGVPVVATESGAVAELLRDHAGILVSPADSRALPRALKNVAEDATLRATLAERGRERVEEGFAVERIAAALHARFRECRRGGMSSRRGGGLKA